VVKTLPGLMMALKCSRKHSG